MLLALSPLSQSSHPMSVFPHNWLPKSVFWLYNMALNNAYKMYTALVKEHTPERRFLTMS